jgi:aminoglycoside phosphotransferase (APT) family kinase protein
MSPVRTLAAAPGWVDDVLHAMQPAVRRRRVLSVKWDGGHSNDIFELDFDDGRTLLLKRARHDWARESFMTSEQAGALLAESSDIVAPRPLPLAGDIADAPVQAYWRIPLPTLAQLWPSLADGQRVSALRSLGALLRRLHDIDAPHYGPLRGADGAAAHDLAGALTGDLQRRLLPAVHAHWSTGAWLLEWLIDRIAWADAMRGPAAASMVHNDLHLGNVLCRVAGDTVTCVGFLDLDGVAGSAPECDIAGFGVLHGPLFEQELDLRWHAEVAHGYGDGADPRMIAFFRCAHLANQGFSSGLLGHDEHAERIRQALHVELDALQQQVMMATA